MRTLINYGTVQKYPSTSFPATPAILTYFRVRSGCRFTGASYPGIFEQLQTYYAMKNTPLYQRRKTRTVFVGSVGVGGNNPVRIQSMTTSDTKDTEGTIRQIESLVRAGCEMVRLTVPTQRDCDNLPHIRATMKAKHLNVPLVADIHFTPSIALKCVDFVEKVRINPGNFVDKKLFKIFEYTDAQYQEELNYLEEKFTPLVLKCRERGVAMRVGTNHGSLSDRIMNRFGDTAQGMVESAVEFLQIAAKNDYHDIILSMKSSNPQVMVNAYRLLAKRLDTLKMDYPFHLGVTEAGEGEDGRIKSAIGIGTLLEEGIGDTIRVSLTEDSEHEIPVAAMLAAPYNLKIARGNWDIETKKNLTTLPTHLAFLFDGSHFVDSYLRRPSVACPIGPYKTGGHELVRVWTQIDASAMDRFLTMQKEQQELFFEGVELSFDDCKKDVVPKLKENGLTVSCLMQDSDKGNDVLAGAVPTGAVPTGIDKLALVLNSWRQDGHFWQDIAQHVHKSQIHLEICLKSDSLAIQDALLKNHLASLVNDLKKFDLTHISFSLLATQPGQDYRILNRVLEEIGLKAPLHLRYSPSELPLQLDASIQLGGLLIDGLGDSLQIDGPVTDWTGTLRLSYNILQASRVRISKAEFISCPSCGRTQFDLQSTTERIRSQTGHLKGVKIAIMGCIVNGPGEMADADFGYVGIGTDKISLYVGKECVERGIPTSEADRRLIELIKKYGKWVEKAA